MTNETKTLTAFKDSKELLESIKYTLLKATSALIAGQGNAQELIDDALATNRNLVGQITRQKKLHPKTDVTYLTLNYLLSKPSICKGIISKAFPEIVKDNNDEFTVNESIGFLTLSTIEGFDIEDAPLTEDIVAGIYNSYISSGQIISSNSLGEVGNSKTVDSITPAQIEEIKVFLN